MNVRKIQDYTPHILELIRLTSTDLPAEVEQRLRNALTNEEPDSAAYLALKTILENVELSRKKSIPICQDTGTPIFYIHHPAFVNVEKLKVQIREAVIQATKKSLLRPNAVDPVTGINTENNVGDDHYPTIHCKQVEGDQLTISLILKGGGCENVGAQYSLPDNRLQAGRDLDGVRKAALDAVYQAQGEGCAPGFLGIAIGGDRGTSYLASKEVFLRGLKEENLNNDLHSLEQQITDQANQLGIGPMGFGGQTTLLGTSITTTYRLPASFFVSVSYMCWAFRRRKMIIVGENVTYY